MIVFADTFALIAWLNPRDNAHTLVAAYLDGFTGRLVTTGSCKRTSARLMLS